MTRLADKYLRRKLEDIEIAELIRDLAGGAVRYGIEVPPDFMMVGKTLMTVEGIVRQIYPGVNLAAEVKPYLVDILGARYSPERITTDLLQLATRLGATAAELPDVAQEILEELRQGRLTLEVRQPSAELGADRLGRRVFTAVVIGALIVGAAVLLASGQAVVGWAMLAVAAGWGFLHSVSMALTRNRPPRG